MSDILPEALRNAHDALPWLVNGTLSGNSRVEAERALAQSELLRAEASWLLSLRQILLNEDLPDDEAPRKADAETASLNSLLYIVRAEPKLHQATAAKVVESRTASNDPKWSTWVRPVFALAAAVMISQAFVIATLVADKDTASITPSSGPNVPGSSVLLQVVFRETATERTLRAALTAARVDIVSGPGQLGVYTVRVAPANADAALNSLRQSPVVERVNRSVP